MICVALEGAKSVKQKTMQGGYKRGSFEVLRITVGLTQLQIKPRICSGEEKEVKTYKDKRWLLKVA